MEPSPQFVVSYGYDSFVSAEIFARKTVSGFGSLDEGLLFRASRRRRENGPNARYNACGRTLTALVRVVGQAQEQSSLHPEDQSRIENHWDRAPLLKGRFPSRTS